MRRRGRDVLDPPHARLRAARRIRPGGRATDLCRVAPAAASACSVAHLSAVLRAPARYLDTLLFALRRANPGLRGRLWGLFYFAESMAIWDAAPAAWRPAHPRLVRRLGQRRRTARRRGSEASPGAGASPSTDRSSSRISDSTASRRRSTAARFTVAISDFGRSQLMTLAAEDALEGHPCRPLRDRPGRVRLGSRARRKRRRAGDPLRGTSGPAQRAIAADRGVSRHCSSAGVPVRLTLVGDGPKRAELEALARADRGRGPRSVRRRVGHDDILPMFRSADIFCLPSFSEGVPVVLMEAMAHSVPVVTTQIMGIPELVENGHSGLLVAPGRVDVLVDALARLVAGPRPSRAARGARARQGAGRVRRQRVGPAIARRAAETIRARPRPHSLSCAAIGRAGASVRHASNNRPGDVSPESGRGTRNVDGI